MLLRCALRVACHCTEDKVARLEAHSSETHTNEVFHPMAYPACKDYPMFQEGYGALNDRELT